MADYGQIELSLAAIIAPDAALSRSTGAGADVHAAVASSDRPAARRRPRASLHDDLRRRRRRRSPRRAACAGACGRRSSTASSRLPRHLAPTASARRARRRSAAASLIRPGPARALRPGIWKGTQAELASRAAPPRSRCAPCAASTTPRRPAPLDARPGGAMHDELILEAPADCERPRSRPSCSSARCGPLARGISRGLEMGADRLAAATICTSWAEKP